MEQLNAELLSTYQSEPAKGWFRSHITDAVLIQGRVALLCLAWPACFSELSPCQHPWPSSRASWSSWESPSIYHAEGVDYIFLKQMHFSQFVAWVTWYFSVCTFTWLSSRCVSGIFGSVAPLGLQLWALKVKNGRAASCPIVHLTKLLIKSKGFF